MSKLDGNTAALLSHERDEAAAEERYRLVIWPLLPRARQELADELMADKCALRNVLDEICNHEDYLAFLDRAAEAVTTQDLYWLTRYVRACVEEYITEDMAEDRARRIAEEA